VIPHSDVGRRTSVDSSRHAVGAKSTLALLLLGMLLAIGVFRLVSSQEAPQFHPWRNDELHATYDTFLAHGVPLLKENGSGSPATRFETTASLVPAAWDDDPGIYLAASYVGRALSFSDPYRALTLVQAALAALPWLWLPLVIARVFGRASVGISTVAILPLLVLLNGGSALLGSDYGRVARYIETPIYALYGSAGSLVFLSLTLLLLAATLPNKRSVLWGVAIGAGFLAGCGNLMRAASGFTIIVAAALVLALFRLSWRQKLAAIAALVVVAGVVQLGTMHVINIQRSDATGLEADELPIGHGTWHPLYLGLGFVGYDDGYETENPFGIIWSDEFGWNKARETAPDVVIVSVEYDLILRDAYLEAIRARPLDAARTYAAKLASAVVQQGSILVFVGVVWLLAFRSRRYRRPLLVSMLVGLPAVLLGLVPPVLVMPMRYYFVENTAGLAVLFVVAVGWIAAVLLPDDKRIESPRSQLLTKMAAAGNTSAAARYSYVVPLHNHEDGIGETLNRLARRLDPGSDETVVVENGSTDESWASLEHAVDSWPADNPRLTALRSEPGLGTAYRVGIAATTGSTVVLSADDLPFDFSDLDAFESIGDPGIMTIGSKAHERPLTRRGRGRVIVTSGFSALRSVILPSSVDDSQGTFFVDGDWIRAYAGTSRETGSLWTTEMVVAAESCGVNPATVPVTLSEGHGAHSSRVKVGDVAAMGIGLLRLRRRRAQHARAVRDAVAMDSPPLEPNPSGGGGVDRTMADM